MRFTLQKMALIKTKLVVARQPLLLFCLALFCASASVASYYADPQQKFVAWQVSFAATAMWVIMAIIFCIWAMASTNRRT
jgi:hypothetical protein